MTPSVTILQNARGFLALLEFPTGAFLGRWFKAEPSEAQVLREWQVRKSSFKPV
jgi:hypothetical protein